MALSEDDLTNLLRTMAPLLDSIELLDDVGKELASRRTTILQRSAEYGAPGSVAGLESAVLTALSSNASSCTSLGNQARQVLFDRDLIVSKTGLPLDATEAEVIDAILTAWDTHLSLLTPPRIEFLVGLNYAPGGTDLDDGNPLLAGSSAGSLALTKSFATAMTPVSGPGLAAQTGAVTDGTPVVTTFVNNGPHLVVFGEYDGVNPPDERIAANPAYSGRLAAAIKPDETLTFEVTADATTGGGGAVAGQETYRLFSNRDGGYYRSQFPGTPSRNQINTVHVTGENILPMTSGNGLFAFTTANVPDNWTVASGIAGTDFSSDAINTFRGAPSLTVNGGGTFQLTRELPIGSFVPRQAYVLSWWEKANASASYPRVEFTTNGVSSVDGLGNQIATEGLFVTTPYGTDEWRLRYGIYIAQDRIETAPTISITGDVNTGGTAQINGINVAPLSYAGGIGYALIPGLIDPRQGDRILLRMTNSGRLASTVDGDSDGIPDRIFGAWSEAAVRDLRIVLPVNQIIGAGSSANAVDAILLEPEDVEGGEDLDVVVTG